MEGHYPRAYFLLRELTQSPYSVDWHDRDVSKMFYRQVVGLLFMCVCVCVCATIFYFWLFPKCLSKRKRERESGHHLSSSDDQFTSNSHVSYFVSLASLASKVLFAFNPVSIPSSSIDCNIMVPSSSLRPAKHDTARDST